MRRAPSSIQALLAHYVFKTDMPTPFYHLFIVKELLSRQILPVDIQQLLEEHLEVFSMGCVAPDVQTLSGQSRYDTHFIKLP